MRKWPLRGEEMGPAPSGGTGIPSQLSGILVHKTQAWVRTHCSSSWLQVQCLFPSPTGCPLVPSNHAPHWGLSDLSLGNNSCNGANSYRQPWPRRKKWGSFCSPCQSLEALPQKCRPPFPRKVFPSPPSFIPNPVPEARW